MSKLKSSKLKKHKLAQPLVVSFDTAASMLDVSKSFFLKEVLPHLPEPIYLSERSPRVRVKWLQDYLDMMEKRIR